MLARILTKIEGADNVLNKMKSYFLTLNQIVTSHSASIKQLETQLSNISTHLNPHPKGDLPSDMVVNPKNETPRCISITTRSGKVVWDMPLIVDATMGDKAKAPIVDDVEEVQQDTTPTLDNLRSDDTHNKGESSKSNPPDVPKLKAVNVKINPPF